jgi:hypothetical protein
MERTFYHYSQTRLRFLELVESLDAAALNKIPQGYGNNILWNFAHSFVTAQLLLYKNSGLEPILAATVIDAYRKGSRPSGQASAEEIQFLIQFAKEDLPKIEADFRAGKFAGFQPYTTSFGIQLHTAEDVISFLPVHEGIHFGYALSLRKLVLGQNN